MESEKKTDPALELLVPGCKPSPSALFMLSDCVRGRNASGSGGKRGDLGRYEEVDFSMDQRKSPFRLHTLGC